MKLTDSLIKCFRLRQATHVHKLTIYLAIRTHTYEHKQHYTMCTILFPGRRQRKACLSDPMVSHPQPTISPPSHQCNKTQSTILLNCSFAFRLSSDFYVHIHTHTAHTLTNTNYFRILSQTSIMRWKFSSAMHAHAAYSLTIINTAQTVCCTCTVYMYLYYANKGKVH